MNLAQTFALDWEEVGGDLEGLRRDVPDVHALAFEFTRGPWSPIKGAVGVEPLRARFRAGSVPERCLLAIREAGKGLSQQEVCDRVVARPKQISVALSDLTARGFLKACGGVRERCYEILDKTATERCAREAEEEEEGL